MNDRLSSTVRRPVVIAAAVIAVLAIALGIRAVASDGGPTALVGTWRPTYIAGFDKLGQHRPDPVTVTFGSDGQWHGSDGCNAIGGDYDASPGKLSAEAGDQTAIGCDNVPNAEILHRAARWEITGTILTLYDKHHTKLATYVRA